MWMTWRPDAKAVLRDKRVRASLPRYFGVLENNKLAKFMVAKKLSATFSKEDSLSRLWKLHDQLTTTFLCLEKEIDSRKILIEEKQEPAKSFLDLKIEIARRILQGCRFCTRRCGFNRLQGELGYCKCGSQITVSTIFGHMGEEPELVPSGTIFTLGCTLRCIHCQNWTISQWYEKGRIYSPEQLAGSVKKLQKSGCRNINLVGGDPTPWLEQWLQTFKCVEVNVPVVWNSNAYYTEETAKLLTGFVDVYLLDFKYGPNKCSDRISSAPSYWEASTRNHLFAKKYGELIVRVLVLPEHLECCTKHILTWIAQNLGTGIRTNVMFQYRPEWRAHEVSELRRKLTTRETKRAIALAKEAGLTNFIS